MSEPEPALPPEDLALLRRGASELEQGLYFECHETLEDLWSGLRGPLRSAVQGVIQLAVAQHHLGRGNLAGAGSLLERALPRLESAPDLLDVLDLRACREQARRLRDWLAAGCPGEPPTARYTLEAPEGPA